MKKIHREGKTWAEILQRLKYCSFARRVFLSWVVVREMINRPTVDCAEARVPCEKASSYRLRWSAWTAAKGSCDKVAVAFSSATGTAAATAEKTRHARSRTPFAEACRHESGCART